MANQLQEDAPPVSVHYWPLAYIRKNTGHGIPKFQV